MDPTLEGKQSLRSPSEQRGEVEASKLTVPTNWIPSQPLMQQRGVRWAHRLFEESGRFCVTATMSTPHELSLLNYSVPSSLDPSKS